MNQGPWLALSIFCLCPVSLFSIGFWLGIRYTRHGWRGMFPKWSKENGIRILRTH
jgi:hypothetical protein